MFLLVPTHPGCPGQIPQSRKTVVRVCVCVSVHISAQVILTSLLYTCKADFILIPVDCEALGIT